MRERLLRAVLPEEIVVKIKPALTAHMASLLFVAAAAAQVPLRMHYQG